MLRVESTAGVAEAENACVSKVHVGLLAPHGNPWPALQAQPAFFGPAYLEGAEKPRRAKRLVVAALGVRATESAVNATTCLQDARNWSSPPTDYNALWSVEWLGSAWTE
jgi:hypothetical protein